MKFGTLEIYELERVLNGAGEYAPGAPILFQQTNRLILPIAGIETAFVCGNLMPQRCTKLVCTDRQLALILMESQ